LNKFKANQEKRWRSLHFCRCRGT